MDHKLEVQEHDLPTTLSGGPVLLAKPRPPPRPERQNASVALRLDDEKMLTTTTSACTTPTSTEHFSVGIRGNEKGQLYIFLQSLAVL